MTTINDKISKLNEWTRNASGWSEAQIEGMIDWAEKLRQDYQEVQEQHAIASQNDNPKLTRDLAFAMEGIEAEIDAWADTI